MARLSNIAKVDKLRKRLATYYDRLEYKAAARTGEALLRAHAGHYSENTSAYADDLYNTALVSGAAGRIDRAIELYTDSIHRCFSKNGADLCVAARLSNLAALLSTHDQHESACRLFMQALTIRKRLLPHNHLTIADALYNMGSALIRANRCREAIPALTGAMNIYNRGGSKSADAGGDNLINCMQVLASAHEQLEEYNEAFPFAEAAWRALAFTNRDEHYRAGYYLAQLYEQDGRHSEACELYLSVMEWAGQTVGYNHSGYINIATKAAGMLAKLEDFRQAKDILTRLQKIIAEMVGHSNLSYSNCIRNLAVVHRQLEEWEEAEALLKESITIKRRIMGGHVREFAADCMLLLDICINNKREDKAAETLLSVLEDVQEDDPAFLELLEEMVHVMTISDEKGLTINPGDPKELSTADETDVNQTSCINEDFSEPHSEP